MSQYAEELIVYYDNLNASQEALAEARANERCSLGDFTNAYLSFVVWGLLGGANPVSPWSWFHYPYFILLAALTFYVVVRLKVWLAAVTHLCNCSAQVESDKHILGFYLEARKRAFRRQQEEHHPCPNKPHKSGGHNTDSVSCPCAQC